MNGCQVAELSRKGRAGGIVQNTGITPYCSHIKSQCLINTNTDIPHYVHSNMQNFILLSLKINDITYYCVCVKERSSTILSESNVKEQNQENWGRGFYFCSTVISAVPALECRENSMATREGREKEMQRSNNERCNNGPLFCY